MTLPLRSAPITEASPPLRAGPPARTATRAEPPLTPKVIAYRLTSGGGCDVGQLGVGEEAADDVRQPLQPAQPGDHDRLHLLEACGCGRGHAVGLDVVPHPLVRVPAAGSRPAADTAAAP